MLCALQGAWLIQEHYTFIKWWSVMAHFMSSHFIPHSSAFVNDCRVWWVHLSKDKLGHQYPLTNSCKFFIRLFIVVPCNKTMCYLVYVMQVRHEVDVSYSVIYLNQTPIFEWRVFWRGSKNGYHIGLTCLKAIQLLVQNMMIIIGSIFNIIGKTYLTT